VALTISTASVTMYSVKLKDLLGRAQVPAWYQESAKRRKPERTALFTDSRLCLTLSRLYYESLKIKHRLCHTCTSATLHTPHPQDFHQPLQRLNRRHFRRIRDSTNGLPTTTRSARILRRAAARSSVWTGAASAGTLSASFLSRSKIQGEDVAD
jgi:hypothetical protein